MSVDPDDLVGLVQSIMADEEQAPRMLVNVMAWCGVCGRSMLTHERYPNGARLIVCPSCPGVIAKIRLEAVQ